MKFWLYSEIKAKVMRDLDLEGETFIQPSEMLGYANEAIDEVERQIHILYEDYFLTRSVITLVPGQELYDIPANIYALKIRSIIYRNGTQVWKLDRLSNAQKLSYYEEQASNSSATQQYGYFIINSIVGQPQIILTPTPSEAGAFLQLWYIRNANELTVDSSICDIPEAANYVIAYIKMKCMEKDLHPNLQKAIADVEQQRADTLATLTQMYADNENKIDADYSLYNTMTGGI